MTEVHVATEGAPKSERRVHLRARAVYPEACQLLARVLSQQVGNAQVSSYALSRVLRDRFSDLDAQEADVLVVAILRLHTDGKLKAE